jgi:hypothetical protein
MYPIAEPDASQARIKGLLKLGCPNTGAVIKACFNVLKAFSQSLVHNPFRLLKINMTLDHFWD